MLVGYARVSTQDQNLDSQMDLLSNAGCTKVFSEIASGSKTERQQLNKAIEFMRSGDILVVCRLDRLGRSLKHLIQIITELELQNIGFKSLQENIDTTTTGGKLVFHLFGALAEFEREIIRERTKAGLSSARARGKLGGRPKKMDDKKIKMAIALHKDSSITINDICQKLNVSRGTLYKYLKNN